MQERIPANQNQRVNVEFASKQNQSLMILQFGAGADQDPLFWQIKIELPFIKKVSRHPN